MTRDSELIAEVRFLLDRLNDFEPYLEEGEAFRQYAGHVSPSVERLREAASRLEAIGEPVAWMIITGEEGNGSTFETDRWQAEQAAKDGRKVVPLAALPTQGETKP